MNELINNNKKKKLIKYKNKNLYYNNFFSNDPFNRIKIYKYAKI